eukprot:m.39412 g.39412  ORF g.39412 m.39412 type:complete len:81 (+) comp32733_c0_seq3:230-472(+)
MFFGAFPDDFHFGSFSGHRWLELCASGLEFLVFRCDLVDYEDGLPAKLGNGFTASVVSVVFAATVAANAENNIAMLIDAA